MISRWLERAIPVDSPAYRRLVVRTYAEVLTCVFGRGIVHLCKGLWYAATGRRERKTAEFLDGSAVWGERVRRFTRTTILRFGAIDCPPVRHLILINHVNELDFAFDCLLFRKPYLANDTIRQTLFAYWWMRAMGSEVFDRKHGRTIAKSVRAVLAGLERHSYIVYPEGSNGYEEDIHPLRKGMLKLAFDHRIPVYVVLKSGLAAFQRQQRDNTIGYTALGIVRPDEFPSWTAFRDRVHAMMSSEKPLLDARVRAHVEAAAERATRVSSPASPKARSPRAESLR